jgi:phenylacetate-CoA ligase
MVPVYRDAWTQIRTLLADVLVPHIDVFNIDKVKLAKFARRLESKPTVLIGNPTALLLLAKFVNESQARPKVSLIISMSDQLLSEERNRLTSIFGTNVYDFYGSNEIGSIAAECEEQVGHHVSSENVIVEIVGTNGAAVSRGQIGSVVITDLNNYTMPLIRYKIGDLSSLLDDECPCGRGLPLLGPIEGRITDVIVTPDGRFMCLSTFGSRVLHETHVEQFQIHQGSRYELTARVVLGPQWRKVEGEIIRRKIQSIVGDAMKVRVDFPEVLEMRPSGKRCLVKSAVMPRIAE